MNPRKNNRFLRNSSLSLAGVMVVSFAVMPKSMAANATWNGTADATWANVANWSAAPVPGAAAGQTATFSNQGGDIDTIDLGSGVTIKSILFDTANTAPYTLGAGAVGSQTLTLETSGTITLNNSAVASQLFNANINLGITSGTESVTLTNNKAANTNTITLAGTVSTTQTDTKVLAVAGSGANVISGAINNGTGTIVLTKAGAGLLTLSGNSNYSGGTTVSNGLVNAGSSTALGAGAVTVGGAAAPPNNTQLQLANGVNVGNALTLNKCGVSGQGMLYVPTGSATYSGTINITTDPTAGGNFAAGAGILTIAGDNTVTTAPLVRVTPRLGITRFTGAQNYTTGVNANGGTIQYGKLSSMPATGIVTINRMSTLAVNVGGAGEFSIGSTATAGTVGGLLAGIGSVGQTINFETIAPLGSSIGIDTSNAVTTQTFNAPFDSTATGGAQMGLLKLGTGTLELNAGGTYDGGGSPALPILVREGTLLLSGGTHTVTGEAAIGGVYARPAGDVGTNAKLQIDAGVLTVSGPLSVGKGNGVGGVSSDLVLNNAAVVNANGGYSASYNQQNALNLPKGTTVLNNTSSLVVGGNSEFNLGQSPGTLHTMTLNNASQVAAAGTGIKRIGNLGTGILNINDTATVNFGSTTATYLGYRTGSGTVNQAGGTVTTVGEVRVGGSDTAGADNGTGTYNLTAGTANLATLAVARGEGPLSLVSGTVNVSGGTLNTVNEVYLGFNGTDNLGKLVVSGTGIVNVGTAAIKSVQVGGSGTSKGELDVSGGALNLLNNTGIRMNAGTTTGANVINQTGGAISFFSNAGTTVGGNGELDLQTAGDAASNNTYNLNGGTLTVPKILSTTPAGARTFNFNGGTLRPATPDVTVLDLGGGTARANVRNGGAIVDTNGLNTTVAQALEHSNVPGDNATDGGLVKQGAGTLTLTGSSTYNGATTVNAGSLDLDGTLTSNITVANNGRITGNGSTTGSLTMAAGSTFSASIDGTPFQANGVTFSGATKLTFDGFTNNGTQYVLFKYGAGGVTGLANLSSTFRSVIVNDPANFQVKGTITTANLTWNSTNGTWAVNTGGWAGAFTSYFDGDDVTFGQRPAASVITLTGPVSPASIVVNNTTSPYTFTGPGSINGLTSLVKDGSGSLTIATANTYSGGTILNAGTLNINSPTAIGTGLLTINGGTIDNTSGAAIVMTNNIPQTWDANFTFTGSNNLDLGRGAVSVAGPDLDRTVTISGGTLAVGELTSFGQGFIKQGAGKLELGSNGLNANGSEINGVLNVAAGEIQFNRTAEPAATSGDFTAAGITGSGTISNGAANARWVYADHSEGSFTFAGTLANGGTGALGFNKNGAGTQTLSGTNSYTDTTTVAGTGELIITGANTGPGTNAEIQNGRLTLKNAQALGTNSLIRFFGVDLATLHLALDADVVGAPYAIMAGVGTTGTIVVDRATAGPGINHTLTTLNTTGISGTTLTFVSGPNVTSGNGRVTFTQFALGSGSVQTTFLNPSTASLTLGNVSKQTNNFSQTIDFGGSTQDNFVTGVISNGPVLLGANNVSVSKSGSSTWTLSGDSTYTGTTTVDGGTLVITGNNSGAPGAVTVSAGGTLGGNGNLGGNVTFNAGGTHAIAVGATPGAQVTRTITGSLTHNFGDTLRLSASSQPAAGTYTLVTANGGISSPPSSVTYSGITGGSVAVVGNSLVLTIGGGGSDFSTWIGGFTFAPGADTTPAGDPDRDGLTNQQEYAFGLAPNSGSSANPITSQLNKATGQFTYTRRVPSLTNLGYVYQFTTDLAVWTPFTPTATVSNNGNPVEAVTVTAPASVTNNAKVFIRVKAQ
ncbi:MAG: hypothetical protein EOP88_01340 [Verrucomicrobiaceae bacterium]|nr:MAG: hypothetical protein EOP88_01340 [Verrucomicrobiaceae bacterium]